jgi:hypothetical protein
MRNCPQEGKWAIAVWDGPDGTDIGQALAQCGAGTADFAYYLDPATNNWLAYFEGQPLISTLPTLDDMQGVLAHGASVVATVTPTPTQTPTPTGTPSLTPTTSPTGRQPSCQVFPADNPWNTDISDLPVHPRSDAYIDAIARDENLHPDFGTVWEGAPNGIPYVIVSGNQPKVPVSFEYEDESDPGPYPIPSDAPIEGGPGSDGDRHVIVIDDDNCGLYELFDAHPINGGESWQAGSGAIFNLNSNDLRPDFWTSADAAGLPIFPGLVRYEEVVMEGVIDHALRFTVEETQRAFIHPATHYASDITDPNLPPMGLRFRMKADYECSGFSQEVQVICATLKEYGMFVADNGGNWFISGAPDERWNDDALADLKEITPDALEVVDTGEQIITD